MRVAGKLILLLFFTISLNNVYGQSKVTEFSEDSVKFLNQLEDYMQTGLATHKDVKEFLDRFTPVWKSPKYTRYYKQVTYDMCNNMLIRRTPVYPVFQAFLNSMMNFVNNGLSTDQFKGWYGCLQKLIMQKPLTNYGLFLSMSENLFGSGVFFKSPTVSWIASSNSYSFNCDSVPEVIFKQTNIKCINDRNDSVSVYATQGIFFPLKGIWIGKGGKVDWVRTGLDANQVYAELNKYTIVCKQSGFVADTVNFWNKDYFDKSLQGVVIEKNVSEPKGKETYPRFISYGKRFTIPNLTPEVTYDGGFSMKGRRFVGSGTNDEPAELIFKKDNKPFLIVASTDYSITKTAILAEDAKVTIHLNDTDSIYHPDIQMDYNIAKKHLSLIRTDQGLSQTPYFDSYHRVNMFFEELSWYLDIPKMELHNLPGSAQNKADFESQAFFRPGIFDAFSDMEGRNGLTYMARYSKSISSRDFKLADFAAYMHLISDAVRPMVMQMANIGLISYDIQTEKIHILDKLFKYLGNKVGKEDYDVIDYHSENPSQASGVLDLLTNDITIHGVRGIILSDSQSVYVYPDSQEIVLHRDRNITFGGDVHAGRFDFFGQHFKFNYEEFKIKMVNTDSVRIQAESFEKDAQGNHHLVPVKSVIEHLTGELAIDKPTNKSGLAGLHQFPILRSDTNSFVFYDKKSIQNGAYKRDKFYFRVDPFTIDSLASFTNAGLHFGGTFSSGGIVPDLPEVLRLQPDYSLGFIHDAPEEGIALYGGKGKFYSKLKLSNQGLKGEGSISYITSLSKSKDFTFFPDSTHGMVGSFVVNEQKTQPEFPHVTGDSVYERWYPKKDFMDVADTRKPFDCYDGKSTFHGHLGLAPRLLQGNGEVDFQKASLTSNLIRFKQHKFLSDTADFHLKTQDVEGGIAFGTKNMNSEVDFEKRMGEFKSNGQASVVQFPVNQYIAYMDEFKWYMDQDEIELSSRQVAAQTAESKELQFSGSRFISTNPKQDSLQFIAPAARYSLKNYLITAKGVPFINVADARIVPDSGKVFIHKNAYMDPLTKAKITANSITKYYNLYNANVTITSRKKYAGSGYYDYVDELKNKRPIYFSNIHVDTTHQTLANTTIPDSSKFELSPYFKFKGDVKLVATNPFLFFDGECRMIHDCNELKITWFDFASQVDPNNIAIPISSKAYSDDDLLLAASPILSTRPDSIFIYPAFLSPIANPKKDVVIASDTGFLIYDKGSRQYRISNKEKLVEQSLPGNYISLDTKRCVLYNEGDMTLGPDYGTLSMRTLGSMTDYMIPDSLNARITMLLNFYFDDGALEKMGTEISNFANLKPFDYSRQDYQKNLRQLMGKEAADKLISQLTLYGTMKRIPKELESTITFNQLNLKWNKASNSYISVGQIALGSVGKIVLNKMVDGHVEFKKKRGGDEINIYLELDPMHWYYFNYSNGLMQAISANTDFNSIVTNDKPDKREEKTDKGKMSFQLAPTVKKTMFLRNMTEGSDN
jgi:hypothetical protein